VRKNWRAVDLFAGCGGLTAGLKRAGFNVVSAVEIDDLAVSSYSSNHPEVNLLHKNIVEVESKELLPKGGGSIDLVAGCPPCQGFSRVRRHNRPRAAKDPRNGLIDQFRRIVEELEPAAVFMENVPGIERDRRFLAFIARLEEMGYIVNWDTLELSDYGVPQRRSRVVVLAGNGFEIEMPRRGWKQYTVRDAIGALPSPDESRRRLHKEITQHSEEILERIRAVPKDGGSRRQWPDKFKLKCHGDFDGFKDVYGRMWWDAPAPTVTGGCINASKGRFLHPEQDRAITLLEAALLQSFSRRYRFNLKRGRYAVAEMIGNALPPVFSERVSRRIIRALENRSHG
jgi:DNA (cytosine-5)-methyltransferase 1